jgi:pyruvate/2-oxoglutarate dehydrogenase complex dihydrolipoamide acyltransferase (E2) component
MTDVLFPQLSKERPDSEGVVATWFVTDGERVQADQLIAEVQVDKVAVEVPAPTAGTIQLLVKEGDAVIQSTPIARVL